MNPALVDQIVSAVLYEGYVLYPYRPSVKNHHRWTFGGIYPRAWSQAHRDDAWFMQAQVPVLGGSNATLRVWARFLHLTARTVWSIDSSCDSATGQHVESLQIGGETYQTWQEAVEREVRPDPIAKGDLLVNSTFAEFSFPGGQESEPLREADGRMVGRLVRERKPVAGGIHLSAQIAADGTFLLTIRIENTSLVDADSLSSRDDALMRSLASMHMILNVERGEFVSLTDPPESLRSVVAQCQNVGCWPVLVGQPGATDMMLASPIILYDYPQVAPESPGDLFDATEIDEILSLRIMTLTDEEKRQAAATDDRVARLLARTDALAREQLLGLHGVIRGMRPLAPEQSHV